MNEGDRGGDDAEAEADCGTSDEINVAACCNGGRYECEAPVSVREEEGEEEAAVARLPAIPSAAARCNRIALAVVVTDTSSPASGSRGATDDDRMEKVCISAGKSAAALLPLRWPP